jgi:hypothetical protein
MLEISCHSSSVKSVGEGSEIMAHHHSASLIYQTNTTDDHNYDDIKSRFCILDAFYRTASQATFRETGMPRLVIELSTAQAKRAIEKSR